MQLEAVFITNGRSTAAPAFNRLVAQSLIFRVKVIENKNWIEANNEAIEWTKAGALLRVDDDMLLHPRAIEFMLNTYKGAICHTAKLYEHFSRRIAGKVRIYNVEKVKSIGGFRANKLGKIDRTFEEDAKKGNHRITTADKHSPVGLHACAPWAEQLEYEKLWGYKKSSRILMKKYRKTVDWQDERADRIIERQNHKGKTKFWQFLKTA